MLFKIFNFKNLKEIKKAIEDKEIISSPMTKEVERVQAAIDKVQNGYSCAIVSSGDPGIYAGTSIATAYTARRIAAILSQNPDADVETIMGILTGGN